MDRTHPDYKGLRGNAPSASPFPQGAPPGQPYGQGHSYAQQQAAAPNPLGPPHPAPFHANNQTDQNFSFSQLNPQQQQFLLQQLQQQQRQQLSPQTQQTQPTQQPFIQSFPQTTGPPQPQFSPQAQAQAQPSSWAAQTAYSAFPPSPFTPAESVSFGDSSALSAVQANVYGFPRSPAPPATAAAVSPPQTPSYNTFLPTSVARAVSGAPSAVSRQTSDVAMPQQQPVLLPQPSVAPSSGSALEYHEDRLVSLFEVERRLAPLGELIYSLQHEPLTRAFNIAITEIKSLVEARAVSPAMSGAGAALPFAVDGLTVHAAAMFDLRSPEAIIAVVPAHTYQDALGNAISGALLDSITVKKGKRSSHPSSARVDGVIFDLSNKRGAQKVSQIALEFEPKGSVCRVARNLFAYHEQSRRVLQLHVSDTDGASVLPVEQLKSFNSMTPSVIVGDVGLYEFRVLYRQPNGTFLLLPKAVFFSKLRPEPKAKRSRTTAAGRSSESLHSDPDYDRTSPPLFMPFPPAAPLPLPVPGVDVSPNASEFSFNEPGPFRALSIMEPVPEESRAAAHKGLYPSPPSGDADGFVKVNRHSDKTALPTVTVVEAPSSSTPDDFVRVSPAGPSSKPGVSSASASAPARSSGPRQWTLSDYVRDATSLCLWADDAFRHIEVELHLGPVSSPSDSVALELQGETGRVLVLQPVYQSPTVLLFELTPAMQQRYWPKSFEAAPATVQAVLIVNGHQHAWSIRFVVEESDEEESEEELAAPAQSQPGQPAPATQQPQSAYTRLPSVPQSVPAPVPNPYTRQTSFPTTAGPVVKPVDLAEMAKAAFVAEEVAEPKETSDEPLNTSDDPSQRTPSAVFGQAALLPPSSSTPKPAQSAPSTRPIARAANPALDQAIQKGRVTGLIDDLGLAFYDRHRAESTEQFIGSLLLEFPPKECVPSYRSLLVAMMKPFLDEFQSGKVQEIAFLTFLLLFGPFDKCFDKFSCLVVPPSGGRPPGRRSWFWGRETNRGVAASNIQSAERGTFLIRLSSNGVSFAVTYIDEDGSLKHSRILNSVPGYHFEDQADLFSSLHELVRSFPHIFKCAFRDPNECVTFKPLNGKPIEVPVKKLQKYPNTLLGSMFDPSNDEVEGREYQQDEFTVPKGSGAVPVVASSAVFAAILEFYNSGAVKRAGLDPKELDEALFLFRIPANEGQ